MDGDEYVRCRHCGYGGCDLRIQCENGCTCHTVRLLRESAVRSDILISGLFSATTTPAIDDFEAYL